MNKPQTLQMKRAATGALAAAAVLSGLVGCGMMRGDRSSDSGTTSSTESRSDSSRRADAGSDTGTPRSSTGSTPGGSTRDCSDRTRWLAPRSELRACRRSRGSRGGPEHSTLDRRAAVTLPITLNVRRSAAAPPWPDRRTPPRFARRTVMASCPGRTASSKSAA